MKSNNFQSLVRNSSLTFVTLLCGLLIVPPEVSAENVGSTTNSTNPGNAFGAIAYSPSTQMYGSSVQPSRQAAETSALRDCFAKSNSRDCRTLIWFENAWGALAVSNNSAYGTGWGKSENNAKRHALEVCQQQGKTSCRVIFTRRAVFYAL
ncbi:DUF4189 domain-containing protein [Aetokthonos hydrillicola Thurmond2011]|uniref:DUF4189 domain-containing protein n=1 Tax=Aetokthonos hydrillicola Thurmond2011 TaxID=2712845 RepID=A0AAP5IA83_9CYAN|nr:DUF4189 domain-containing protein [Aetokthonos hydrillicola]MBW4586168.1 DUF4189 domain-containing protein [Aetokthonos hydrillicola CCALA 1050]MDR9897775.1 DUF4189 domain-containing protein [Aetokthonos hydrillicola Thurmond2011]